MMKDFEVMVSNNMLIRKVDHIENNIVYTEDKEIKADTIVNALGSKKNIFVEENIHIPFAYIGDCSGERTADIASAVRSAYQAANAID